MSIVVISGLGPSPFTYTIQIRYVAELFLLRAMAVLFGVCSHCYFLATYLFMRLIFCVDTPIEICLRVSSLGVRALLSATPFFCLFVSPDAS